MRPLLRKSFEVLTLWWSVVGPERLTKPQVCVTVLSTKGRPDGSAVTQQLPALRRPALRREEGAGSSGAAPRGGAARLWKIKGRRSGQEKRPARAGDQSPVLRQACDFLPPDDSVRVTTKQITVEKCLTSTISASNILHTGAPALYVM